jgi:AraC-like DNA-binding protein
MQVKQLIESNVKHHYTLQQLAQRFHVSETKLRQDFYAEFGVTIYQFRIQLRVEKAKELLINTNYPIEKIASMVGCTLENLEKTFKKSTRTMPRVWRKEYRRTQATGRR